MNQNTIRYKLDNCYVCGIDIMVAQSYNTHTSDYRNIELPICCICDNVLGCAISRYVSDDEIDARIKKAEYPHKIIIRKI